MMGGQGHRFGAAQIRQLWQGVGVAGGLGIDGCCVSGCHSSSRR